MGMPKSLKARKGHRDYKRAAIEVVST